MMSKKAKIFPTPGGFVDGWVEGYKRHAHVLDGDTWSVYLGCFWHLACQLFNSGIVFYSFWTYISKKSIKVRIDGSNRALETYIKKIGPYEKMIHL